ncbi:M23 family metallopeptidase [Streptomyces sp. NPDC057638]|uniref:M23 family metallopeptidase n=1 Tax=Streptomyces sp. NPDC057638 TaxID=3346190 RepID=UPI0036AC9122
MSTRTRKLLMVLYRASWITFVVMIVVSFTVELPLDWAWGFAPAVAALVIGSVVTRSQRAAHSTATARTAVECLAPVAGRWSALNSPADKVPSHGTHAYGQSYAIDITAEPEEGTRPGFSLFWPLVRRPSAYPAFGAPLLAVADATVVHASDGQRDHLSRSSLPMIFYLLLLEGAFRDMFGPSRIIGNTVVLDLGGGTYALYAHVQRGSLMVRTGDRVSAGQPIARCGNSGNSTEPHVHFQLMDGTDPDTARGIPFRWTGVGVPANKQRFTVDPDDPYASVVEELDGAAGADAAGGAERGDGEKSPGTGLSLTGDGR